jgi:hypothetical protein
MEDAVIVSVGTGTVKIFFAGAERGRAEIDATKKKAGWKSSPPHG